jgi:hypothetical protein
VQILCIAAIVFCALVNVMAVVMYDWHRLSQFAKWIRALPAAPLVGLP